MFMFGGPSLFGGFSYPVSDWYFVPQPSLGPFLPHVWRMLLGPCFFWGLSDLVYLGVYGGPTFSGAFPTQCLVGVLWPKPSLELSYPVYGGCSVAPDFLWGLSYPMSGGWRASTEVFFPGCNLRVSAV